MLNRLRRKLTALAACLTGSVVVAVCVVSFLLIRGQYLRGRVLAFELAAASVFTQWQFEDYLSADWLQASMDANQFEIALWENHIPLSYSLSDPVQAKLLLEDMPSAAEKERARSFCVGDYRCILFDFPFSFGSRQFLMWQDTAGEHTYLLRMGFVFFGITAVSLSLVVLLCNLVSRRAILPAQDAMERQEHFVAAASHELRSPLTVLRTGLGVIEKDPAQTERYLSLVREETDRMSRLVNDLLTLASGGRLRKTFHPDPIEADTLLIEFADSMTPVAGKTGVHLEVCLPEDPAPAIRADSHMLRQLLTILVDNALRYAPRDSSIELTLSFSSRHCLLSVADHGPGICDKEKALIFDRFYRGTKSRTESTHFGLGLSVARELAAIHGGSIDVSDTPGGGATFLVVLPR